MPQIQREGLGDPRPGLRRLWWPPLEDLVTVLGAMAKVQTIGLLEVKTKTRSRSLSPCWAAWSRMWRSSLRRRSTRLFCPLRNLRLVIFFPLGASLKDEGLKVVPVQRQMLLVIGRLMSLFGDYDHHVVLVWSAPRRELLSSKGSSFWANFPSSLCREANEGTRLASCHCSMKVTGHHGCVLVYLIPASRGTGDLVSNHVSKKLLPLLSIMAATHQPGAVLPPGQRGHIWFHLQDLQPFIWLWTSGKRLCSPRLPIRNSLNII